MAGRGKRAKPAAAAAEAANDNSSNGSGRKWTPRDVYQEVTDRILEMLDAGTVPWHNPIRGAGGEWPKNLASGKPYRGVNVFLLAMTALARGYDSPWWTTFRQAREKGGQVRKGEKSTPVIFWKKLLKDEEEPERDADGKPARPPFVLRYYHVFNAAAQCEGLERCRPRWTCPPCRSSSSWRRPSGSSASTPTRRPSSTWGRRRATATRSTGCGCRCRSGSRAARTTTAPPTTS